MCYTLPSSNAMYYVHCDLAIVDDTVRRGFAGKELFSSIDEEYWYWFSLEKQATATTLATWLESLRH